MKKKSLWGPAGTGKNTKHLLASFPGPPQLFSVAHRKACVEKIGEPGDEAMTVLRYTARTILNYHCMVLLTAAR